MVHLHGRVFILDFAQSLFRDGKMSDDVWGEMVHSRADIQPLKELRDEKELRDITPPEPFFDSRRGHQIYNRQIQKARKEWREKYYRPASVQGDFEITIEMRGVERFGVS
jgi:hypothetical protein